MGERVQNPLISQDRFIADCTKRGIDIDEDILLYLVDRGLLDVEIINNTSYYAIYSVEWVDYLLQAFSFILNPSKKSIFRLTSKNGTVTNWLKINKLPDALKKKEDVFNQYIDEVILDDQHAGFQKKLHFLQSIDEVYYPYAKSGAGTIQVQSHHTINSDFSWRKAKQEFNLESILKQWGLTINDVTVWYGEYSKKAAKLLGGNDPSWMQLFKEASWTKKEQLEGRMRLGIDYLQWSLMLKRCVEDHVHYSLLDIDELYSIANEDILTISKSPSIVGAMSIRTFRDNSMSDGQQDNYHERFKRLQWLANSLGLNYHPKLMVFVEGKCEERVLPKLFQYKYGTSPTSMGIEFVNYKGVDKLQSTAQVLEDIRRIIGDLGNELKKKPLPAENAEELRRIEKKLSSKDLALASLKDLVSYNLIKWQTIPFFIADNEGGIGDFIKSGKVIRYKDESRSLGEKDYDVPLKWKYMWGIDNNNLPLYGKDLETANFTDREIAEALSKHTGHEFEVEDVTEMRDQGRGISQLVKDKTGESLMHKLVLIEALFDRLLAGDNLEVPINERPFNDVLSRIANHTSLNHQPSNLNHQKLNEQIIINDLLGRTL